MGEWSVILHEVSEAKFAGSHGNYTTAAFAGRRVGKFAYLVVINKISQFMPLFFDGDGIKCAKVDIKRRLKKLPEAIFIAKNSPGEEWEREERRTGSNGDKWG